MTRIMHELRSGPCPPQSLLGSVVERRSAESEDLRSDSHGDSEYFLCLTLVMRRKKISLFISLAGSKSKHLSYSLCYPVGIFQISQKVYA